MLFSAGSAVVIARLIGAKDDFNVFLFSSLMIFNPVICRHMQFLPHHLPLALAFVLLAIVCEIAHKVMHAQFANLPFPTLKMLLLCSFVFALMTGVRQDFAILSCILFVAIFLNFLHEQPHSAIKLRVFVFNITSGLLMLGLSVVIYYSLNKFSLYLVELTEPTDNYGTFNSVVSSQSELAQALSKVRFSLFDYFIDRDLKLTSCVKGLIAIISSLMALTVCGALRQKFRLNIFVSLFFGLFFTSLILFLPWTIAIFHNHPNSTSLTALIGLIATWSVLFSYASVNGLNIYTRRFAGFVGVVTLMIFVSDASQSSYKIHTEYDQLKAASIEILHDIRDVMKKEKYSTSDSVTVVVANSKRFLPIDDGYVFIEWVLEMLNYDPRLKIVGIQGVILPESQTEALAYLKYIDDLVLSTPEWPAENYIKAYGDIIIVKLNPKAPHALGAM